MFGQEEKTALLQKLKGLREDIARTRADLNKIDEQKEALYAKKEEFSTQIRALIHDVKQKKEQRDKLTENVKSKKHERNEINQIISQKSNALKLLLEKKEKTTSPQTDPVRLKKEI